MNNTKLSPPMIQNALGGVWEIENNRFISDYPTIFTPNFVRVGWTVTEKRWRN